MPNIKRGMMAAAGGGAEPCEDCGLFAMGTNADGQLGLGDTTARSSPVQTYAAVPTSYSAGKSFSGLVKTDGTLWMTGRNNYGQLGLGTAGWGTEVSSWTQVGTDTTWDQVSCGTGFTIARKTDGTIWTWGDDFAGALGNGTLGGDVSSPVQVGSLTDWTTVLANGSSVAAYKDDALWCWGKGENGQMGDGVHVNYSSPVQVASSGYANGIRSSSGEQRFLAHHPKTNNAIVAAGYGYRGALGLGATSSTNVFTQIGSTDWTWVTFGNYNIIARRTNGDLYAWGYAPGYYGANGDGTTTTRSSPVQIGSGETWGADFRHGASSQYGSMAINTSGELFGWGYNGQGQLGPNGTNSVPTQVGTETDWVGIDCGGYHTFGVRDDS